MVSNITSAHPRDRFISVFGRKPVYEALSDLSLEIDKVLLDRNARGEFVADIIKAAQARNIPLKRVDAREVTRISKNARQDQGAVADVSAPRMISATEYFASLDPAAKVQLLALDGVTTPANVGMAIRSAAAAGVTGIILPRHGTSGLNPLVIKSSAGLVFKARLIRCEFLEDALALALEKRIEIIGLDGAAKDELFDAHLPRRAIYVLGNESLGMSKSVRRMATRLLRIPMEDGVESMNVAAATTLVCFEARRRKLV